MHQLFHQHVLIKAHVTTPPRSEDSLNQWLRDLVLAVGMQVCLEPHSIYVSQPGNEGLTGNIGLETSHAAIHIWDEQSPALVQMDLYSCREFSNETVLELLNKFGGIDYELMTIDRNEGFVIVEHRKGTF